MCSTLSKMLRCHIVSSWRSKTDQLSRLDTNKIDMYTTYIHTHRSSRPLPCAPPPQIPHVATKPTMTRSEIDCSQTCVILCVCIVYIIYKDMCVAGRKKEIEHPCTYTR